MKIHGINPTVLAAYAQARSQPSQPSASMSGAFALERASTSQAPRDIDAMSRLVAGKVSSGINRGEGFDQIPPEGFARQTLQLYRNSAERVEAATRVATGRILDTTA